MIKLYSGTTDLDQCARLRLFSMTWSPTSWQDKPTQQQPTYPDDAALAEVLQQLASLPPLVTSWEIQSLRAQLAEAQDGRRFLLQGGDCAESFAACTSERIAAKLKILLQMSLVLVHGTKKQVIRVGRFAGQYAKPRSADTEARDGQTLPSYRGDNINASDFSEHDRTPNPQRLLRGYERAALTLNFIRALIDGGFADLHHPEYWDLDFVQHSPLAAEYQRMVEQIGESLRFMETLSGNHVGQLNRVDFFTSHEALHLPYEASQTRRVPHRDGWFNLSTHFPWLGNRTRQLDGGHVEYLRGLRNPVAVKVGPGMFDEELQQLIAVLNPHNEPGRLTLIHRLGVDQVRSELPRLIDAVQSTDASVLWVCDPMHGNTQITTTGRKTRQFDHILGELEESFDIHHDKGTYLGGVHVEVTGENVTECTGGARGLNDADLERDYVSHVDPRLNYEQALEMAMRIANRMRG